MSTPAQVTEAHRKLSIAVWAAVKWDETPCGAQLIADSEAAAVAKARELAMAGAHEWLHAQHGALIAERDQLRAEVERLKDAIENQADRIDSLEAAHAAGADAERYRLVTLRQDAELAALRADRNNLRADLDAIKTILTEEKARAERAEVGEAEQKWLKESAVKRAKELTAELDGIRALADRRNKRYHVEDTTHQLVAALDQALDIAQAELAAERARLRQIALDACRSAKITPIVWYPKGYTINPNDLGKINEHQVEACVQAIDAAMKEGA